MHPVLELLLSLLCAAGLMAIGWVLFGRLVTPVGGRSGGPVCAVIPAAGSGETLEHDIRGLRWLQGGNLADFTIIIADAGLDSGGRAAAAALMTRYPRLVYCPLEQLSACVDSQKRRSAGSN